MNQLDDDFSSIQNSTENLTIGFVDAIYSGITQYLGVGNDFRTFYVIAPILRVVGFVVESGTKIPPSVEKV